MALYPRSVLLELGGRKALNGNGGRFGEALESSGRKAITNYTPMSTKLAFPFCEIASKFDTSVFPFHSQG